MGTDLKHRTLHAFHRIHAEQQLLTKLIQQNRGDNSGQKKKARLGERAWGKEET